MWAFKLIDFIYEIIDKIKAIDPERLMTALGLTFLIIIFLSMCKEMLFAPIMEFYDDNEEEEEEEENVIYRTNIRRR